MGNVAKPVTGAQWPLRNLNTGRRRYTFGASRAGGKRKHAGNDLYAKMGEEVIAPESGTVVAFQKFNGPRAVAMLIQTDRGPVILLGEILPGSWKKYGIGKNSRVEMGQTVAEVGINPGGSQMLHYEMYHKGTLTNMKWYPGRRPDALLDPTLYLKQARKNSLLTLTTGVMDKVKPVDPIDDPVDDPIDDPIEPIDDPIDDPIEPIRPIDPLRVQVDGEMAVIAIIGVVLLRSLK